jgi:hypothetical protein
MPFPDNKKAGTLLQIPAHWTQFIKEQRKQAYKKAGFMAL